jgi:pyruvate kinase
MNCMCGDEDCAFLENVNIAKESENLIFTADNHITQQELIHVMMTGVRILNLDLAHGTDEELQHLLENFKNAIKIFKSESKFNIHITKVCSFRGRIPRTGRMRNDCEFMLRTGDDIVLTSDDRYQNCSTNKVCYVTNFQRFLSLLKPGDEITIGGEIVLEVRKIALSSYVTCCVVETDCLKSYQKIKIPALIDESLGPTQEECEDLEFAKRNQFDIIIVPSVNRPEYYHKLKKLIEGSEIKVIAGIEKRVAKDKIDRIIEHFYGVFIESFEDCIIAKARECKKLVIARFPREKCFGYRSTKLCDKADSLLLKPSRSLEVFHEASMKLRRVLTNLEKNRKIREELNEEKHEEIGNICISSALAVTKTSAAKAIVCITQRESTARSIARSPRQCPVILLTKCPKIAKRIQLWPNVKAMVYVDCEKKTWKDQRKEMTKIASVFGKEMEMFEANNLIVTCCNSESESGDVNTFKIAEINEICK